MGRPSRREEILIAALDCFAENGNRGTSLTEIADRVGVTHTAVRYHFETRTDLILAVLEYYDLRLEREHSELLRLGTSAVLSDQRLAQLINPEQAELSRLFHILQAEGLKGDDKVRTWFADRRRRMQKQIASFLRAGLLSGEYRPDLDPDLKACEILCFIGGANLQYLVDPEQVDLVAVLASYRDAVITDLYRDRRKQRTAG